jgi:methionyl aminopeptidase
MNTLDTLSLRADQGRLEPLVLRSAREIRLMRKAGLVVWEAHQAAAKMIRPGITTAEVDAAVAEVFERRQALPLFKGVPGVIPFPAVTCISVNEEVVHGIPGERRLAEGDIVSVDTGCKINGWCGDAAVTHAVGEVDATKRKLLEITKGSLDLAIELLPKMKRWSQVAAAMAKYVREAGFSVVEDFVGHGIGRNLHEDPKVPNYVSDETRESDFELRRGLVLAIEPMVNVGVKEVTCLADHWTQVTVDRLPSAHFEHTIALTKDGAMALTGPPGDGESLD